MRPRYAFISQEVYQLYLIFRTAPACNTTIKKNQLNLPSYLQTFAIYRIQLPVAVQRFHQARTWRRSVNNSIFSTFYPQNVISKPSLHWEICSCGGDTKFLYLEIFRCDNCQNHRAMVVCGITMLSPSGRLALGQWQWRWYSRDIKAMNAESSRNRLVIKAVTTLTYIL